MTHRPVRIKSAAQLRAEITSDHSEQAEPDAPPASPAEKPGKEKGAKKDKVPKPEKVKKVSGLDAAAHVLKDAGKPAKVAASMAKVFASEVAMKAATRSLQIHGGAGYLTEFPIERIFRDAKLTEIGEGTSEVQRTVIARAILDLR